MPTNTTVTQDSHHDTCAVTHCHQLQCTFKSSCTRTVHTCTVYLTYVINFVSLEMVYCYISATTNKIERQNNAKTPRILVQSRETSNQKFSYVLFETLKSISHRPRRFNEHDFTPDVAISLYHGGLQCRAQYRLQTK